MGLKQLEPTVRKVGDNVFYITPFPAFRAANLSGELASVLAPLSGVVAAVMSGTDGETFNFMDLDVKKVADGMSGCAELSGDKLEAVMKKLLLGGHISVEFTDESGEKSMEKLDIDLANEIFCGEIQDMYVLCFHVIQLNFNGFFKRLAALSGAAKSDGKPRPML